MSDDGSSVRTVGERRWVNASFGVFACSRRIDLSRSAWRVPIAPRYTGGSALCP